MIRATDLMSGSVSGVDVEDLSVQDLMDQRVREKLQRGLDLLESIELIGMEVGLEQQSNSTIRADFLAVFPGTTGIGIIELKKSAQTERQAFTELLAYSNHLTTLFPTMTREDIVYVLISPMETRICRDAVLQSLLFDNRNIVALIPEFDDPNKIESLRLNPWVPSSSELATFTDVAFREDNFSVCKIVWEYCEGWWDAPKGENPTPGLVAQLNDVSALAAQCMEEAGIHGFVYASQTWSELSPVLPFTNALVLVGLNPYAVGGLQILVRREQIEPAEAPSAHEYLPNLAEVIPGLNRHAKDIHQENNFLSDLHSVWDSQLFRIGHKVVTSVTQTLSGSSLMTDQGFMNWHTFQQQLLEDVTCHNLAVRPTGILRHLFLAVTKHDYDFCGANGAENHPIHGDMYHHAVEALVSHHMFRTFILRLVGETDA